MIKVQRLFRKEVHCKLSAMEMGGFFNIKNKI
nr:MAG TPA: hypothetical protein [Caudoviricetes sp.]